MLDGARPRRRKQGAELVPRVAVQLRPLHVLGPQGALEQRLAESTPLEQGGVERAVILEDAGGLQSLADQGGYAGRLHRRRLLSRIPNLIRAGSPEPRFLHQTMRRDNDAFDERVLALLTATLNE